MCLTLFLNTSWIHPLFGVYGGVIAEDVFSFQTITIFGGGKLCCVFSKGQLPLR